MLTKITTGKVRFSYANLFTPKAAQDGGMPKYSVSLIIPKSDTVTLSKINAAVEAAKKEGAASQWNGQIPPVLKLPLRDGDAERPNDEAYKNNMFFNCSSNNKPGIIDKGGNEIISPEEIVSGDFGKVSVNFYAFNKNGNRGIAAGLGNILFLEKGEPLSSQSSAWDDFADEIGGDNSGLV